jgi:hypothetical protein
VASSTTLLAWAQHEATPQEQQQSARQLCVQLARCLQGAALLQAGADGNVASLFCATKLAAGGAQYGAGPAVAPAALAAVIDRHTPRL